MTDLCFVDTNVFVYAKDPTDPEKRGQAEAWLATLARRGALRLSVQVLNEYYDTVTRRLTPSRDVALARSDVALMLTWRPLDLDGALIETAWRAQDRYGFSWWDSLIVAAAQRADCRYLLSEDLQHAQDLDGVAVLSPFETSADAIL